MSGQRNNVVRGGSAQEGVNHAEAASAGVNNTNPRHGSNDRPTSDHSGSSAVEVTPLRIVLSDGQELVPASFNEARRDLSSTVPSNEPVPESEPAPASHPLENVPFRSSRPPVNRSIVINEGGIPPRSLPVAFGKGKEVLVDDFPPRIPRDRTRVQPFPGQSSGSGPGPLPSEDAPMAPTVDIDGIETADNSSIRPPVATPRPPVAPPSNDQLEPR